MITEQMGFPIPPAAASAMSLPVCLLAPPSMPSLGNCFPCVTVNLGKYVLYSSALSWRAHWRTSLAVSFGGAGVSLFLMENIINDKSAGDFGPKEMKMRTQCNIYICRDTEDGPLEIIPSQVLLWYHFYVCNFYIYEDDKLQKAF